MQWANLSKHCKIDSISRVDSFYMQTESITEPENYDPFSDFFIFIDKLAAGQNLGANGYITILDIGCGNGIFISECLRRGFNVMGVEADQAMINYMPKEVVDRVIFKPIEKIDRFDYSFDVITFWDSFEHLENAFDILDKVRLYVKDNGVVYLRVNNNRDIYNWITQFILKLSPQMGKKKFLKKCFGLPWHRWNFSYEGMRNLLQKKNWRIIHFSPGETPASRFTSNVFIIVHIKCAYIFNKLIRGGKIGNYYINKL